MMFKNGQYVVLADYMRQPPAWFHTRILVGPGAYLTPRFASQHGITHVINCAMEHDSPEWFRLRTPEKYVCLNAIDSAHVNILGWYPAFESAMLRFLREGTGVVYVHCQAGMNRSGSLALAYVCKRFHMPLEETVVAVRRQRSVLLQNPVFMNQVRNFINGCVPSEKNTRLDVDRVHDGNSGLFAPDDRPGSEGLENNAGQSENRAGDAAGDDIGSVFQE